MRRLLFVLLLVLAGTPNVQADESATAAGVTEPGRSLDRALDVILDMRGRDSQERTLFFLVDPTASLQTAAFADRLTAAFTRNADRMGTTTIGVARTGAKKGVALKPTADLGAVLQTVTDVLAKPDASFQNVYADLRRVAGALSGKSGARELVLVTLENGDAEDDLEATVAALRRAKIRLHVIAREALLADSYYSSHASTATKPPRGTRLTGGDGAFEQIPWGWIFQKVQGNEVAPAGFAFYGLSRLARATEGRVFLYSTPDSAHQCAFYDGCPFCTNDHTPPGESYQTHRVKATAPITDSRKHAYAAAAGDPFFRATLKLWGQASKQGLVRSKPSVKLAGGSLKLEQRRSAAWLPLTTSLSFKRNANRADKAVKACSQLITSFEADIERARSSRGLPRFEAQAEYTRVMLHLTRLNLMAYSAWCKEAGPTMIGKIDRPIEPPERPWYGSDMTPVGIGYSNMCLCHGVAPFQQVHLPGGEAFKLAIRSFGKVFAEFTSRYDHGPFGIAIRRAGIARFYPTFRGKTTTPPPREKPSSSSDSTTTTTGRPSRGPGGGSSGGGGATTGG